MISAPPELLRDDLAAQAPAIVIESPAGDPRPPPAAGRGGPAPAPGYLDDAPEEPDEDEGDETDDRDGADGDTDD